MLLALHPDSASEPTHRSRRAAPVLRRELPSLLLSTSLLSIVGCGSDPDSSPTPSAAELSVDICGPITLECPSTLETFGTAGGFQVESFDVDWVHMPECGVSTSEPLFFQMPEDLLSFSVTVEEEALNTGFAWLSMGSQTVIDWNAQDDTGWNGYPHFHYPGLDGSIVFPQNEDSAPQPGCLAIIPLVDGEDVGGQTGTVHLVSRRGPEEATTFDVNLVIASGAEISDSSLEAALTRMDELYSNFGITLGTINRYDVNGSVTYYEPEGEDLNALRATRLESSPRAMNFFFVADFTESGILGMAAGIPGPIGVEGTYGSGVAVAVDSHRNSQGQILTTLMGETMAHEAGHQLGLFHTTESEGTSFDSIGDTAECPASRDADKDGTVSAEECEDLDGRNFMFWSAASFPQDGVSGYQGQVLGLGPLMY